MERRNLIAKIVALVVSGFDEEDLVSGEGETRAERSAAWA